MMGKAKVFVTTGFVFLALVLSGIPAFSGVKFITITSGPIGGEWYILGGSLAELVKEEIPNVKVTATTGGGLSNPTKVNTGKADIGLTQDRLLYEAREGIGGFKDQGPHENIMGMVYLADIWMSVFLVREDYPVNSIDEIKEKRVPIRIVTAPRASTPSLAAERMFAEYGITFDDIRSWGGKVNFVSYSEGASLIKDGHADAYCGPIMPAIVDLAFSKKIKMLPVKESVLDALRKKFKYGKGVIPKDSYYFVKEDTPVMTESPIFIVRKDLPDDIVYRITKAICNNPDRIRKSGRTYRSFSPENAWRIFGGPIHPGALRYYREQGWIK